MDAGTYNTGLGYRYASTAFAITKEELMKLGSVDLLKFQASLKNNINYPLVDEELKQKNSDKIRINATCILTEFNLATSKTDNKDSDKKISKDVIEYKCGYNLDKVDAFTKKRSVLTKPGVFFDLKMDGGGHIFFQAEASNTNGINGFRFWYCITKQGISQYKETDLASVKSIMLFDQVDIMLENDKPVSLKTNEISEFLFQPQLNSLWSYKQFTVENDSLWQSFKTMPIKTLRASINGKVLWTQDIDKNYSTSFIKVINCLESLNLPKQGTSASSIK
jgi:hypothetical protein